VTAALRSYAIVTFAYWSFTLTDGALRMLVLLHFHRLGFSPLSLATLFLLYELCGVLTNLMGGWIGSRFGLKLTLLLGLGMQVGTLLMLAQLNTQWSVAIQVVYVFLAQGLSGIAKDFTKISAKSAIRVLVPAGQAEGQSHLFRWVALLTGSKNTLKGAGFFLGAWLLAEYGFAWSLRAMAIALGGSWLFVLALLARGLGKAKFKAKFASILSKSSRVNRLSLARFFLFGARDIWFAVALPVYLYQVLGWSFVGVGTFMASWVIGYGFVQAGTPRILRRHDSGVLLFWGALLACVPLAMVAAFFLEQPPTQIVLIGLTAFALFFAINSALHSYLILEFADDSAVSLDVGFYYMANAGGRLVGTLLSGAIYQAYGLTACLVGAFLMLAFAALIAVGLKQVPAAASESAPQQP
jgi:MFS family permease